jgi:transcriptional regulator with XRE-family HTH domain
MKAKEFGKYLRTIRKNRKLTIRQLELYSGVSNGYLSQLETGKRGIPSPEILKKLSTPLGVSYEELMLKAGYLDDLTTDEQKLFKEAHYVEFTEVIKDRIAIDGEPITEKEKDLILDIVRRIIKQYR